MRTISQKCAAVLIVALCLLGNRSALATDWVHVGGNVHFDGIPLCALVLINGQTQFSCDGLGRYDMQVPVDDNGMVTVMVFADGFAPFNQIVTPEQAADYPVDMLLDQNSPSFQVETTYEPSATEGRFVISGTIHAGTFPVCALILANGQNMFSCNESLARFWLDVPSDQDGNITLMAFAAGFKPFKKTIKVEPDSDGDGVIDRLDDDDDNDGILDELDSCPLNPLSGCAIPITETINVNGKVWAQVKLFTNLSTDQINAVCPGGFCYGILNGYDVTGWTWATLGEVQTLFNHYIGSTELGPDKSDYNNTGPRFFYVSPEAGLDGWKWTSVSSTDRERSYIIGYPSDKVWDGEVLVPVVYIMHSFSTPSFAWPYDEYETFGHWFVQYGGARDENIGAWIYRQ